LAPALLRRIVHTVNMKKLALILGAVGGALFYIASRRSPKTFDEIKQIVIEAVESTRTSFNQFVDETLPDMPTFDLGSFTPPITTEAPMASTNNFGTAYDDLINRSAIQYGVEPRLLYKLLKQESAFLPDVINGTRTSSTGALGIAQFMPATARQELGSVAAALDPERAIPGAARYLAKLKNNLGDWKSAVAAYNWGIGNVQRKGLDRAPAETVDYINKVYFA
jgi:Transglycosylase SLT domain